MEEIIMKRINKFVNKMREVKKQKKEIEGDAVGEVDLFDGVSF